MLALAGTTAGDRRRSSSSTRRVARRLRTRRNSAVPKAFLEHRGQAFARLTSETGAGQWGSGDLESRWARCSASLCGFYMVKV